MMGIKRMGFAEAGIDNDLQRDVCDETFRGSVLILVGHHFLR